MSDLETSAQKQEQPKQGPNIHIPLDTLITGGLQPPSGYKRYCHMDLNGTTGVLSGVMSQVVTTAFAENDN